jgi:putative glutamine amidotransferase
MPLPPIILISGSTEPKGSEMGDASLSLAIKYPLALKAAGAMPWLLPCIPEPRFIAGAVKRCAGVMLTGGDDIDPKLYTARLPPRVARTVHRESPERDAFEMALVAEVFRQRKPLLCICRGHQMLNVALGGTLFADIKIQLPQARDHCRTDRKSRMVHEVRCTAGSLMARIAGRERLGVNSTHHQAVARIAKPLRATAVTNDGIIEGLELAPDARGMTPYLLSVQFHPERLFEQYAEHLTLFRSFVGACSRNGRSKYEA